MSFGNIFSGIGYAIVGFAIGGWAGAAYGFAIGFGMSLLMDALAPDMPSPGQPQTAELAFPTATEGLNIPDVLGTSKMSGNIFQYFGNRVVEITEEQEGGKGGGGSQEVTTGYEYYLSWAMGICLGPVDYLYTIFAGDDVVWSGNLARPDSGGLETITLTITEYEESEVDKSYSESISYGNLSSEGYYGAYYQYSFTGLSSNPFSAFDDNPTTRTLNDALLFLYINGALPGQVGEYSYVGFSSYISHTWDSATGLFRIILDNPISYTLQAGETFSHFLLVMNGTVTISTVTDERTMGTAYFYFGTDDHAINTKMQGDIANTPAYRHLCYIFFDDNYIGPYNRVAAMKFVIGKFPQLDFNANNVIGVYDYNPAHAIWYIQTNDWMAQLPEEYMDAVTFSAVADTLYSEGRGISILFDRQQTALAYIENILNHVGGVMRYSATGDLSEEPE